jgi:hypothetical protein
MHKVEPRSNPLYPYPPEVHNEIQSNNFLFDDALDDSQEPVGVNIYAEAPLPLLFR